MESEEDFERVFKRRLALEQLKEMSWYGFTGYDLSKLSAHEMSIETYNYHVNKNKAKQEKNSGI